jgi:nucleoside-diphosphate-sugar epimerase
MAYPSKRFIFLGSSGRVGQMLARIWPHAGGRDLLVDWQYRQHSGIYNPCVVWPNFASSTPLLEHVQNVGRLDGMFMFCGVTPQSAHKSEMHDNIRIARDAVNAAVDSGIKRVILASSSAVYGEGLNHSEASRAHPASEYGAAKLEMEQACRRIAGQHDLELCCLRIGNVVGADSVTLHAANTQSILELDIYPDGSGPRRSYVGPDMLAKILIDLALYKGCLPDVLNVGSRTPVTMDDLLNAANIRWSARMGQADASQNITLNCTLLEQLCGAGIAAATPMQMITEWRNAGASI